MASTWCILLLLVAGLAFVVAEQALEQTQEDEPVATRKLHAASLIIPLLSTVGGFLSAMTGIRVCSTSPYLHLPCDMVGL